MMFKFQGGKFSSVLGGQAKIQEIKKLPCIQGTQLQKAFKILFDYLPWHLLSGRKIPCLFQLMVPAVNNFQSKY